LFWPLLKLVTAITRTLTRAVGGERRTPFTLREEIVMMVEMSALADGDIKPVEQEMIRRVFDFQETCARDIMTPLIDVQAVALAARVGEVRGVAVRSGHKRLPVYDRRIDQVVGRVDALDLLLLADAELVADHVRPVPFLPGSRPIDDVLRDLRHAGRKLAVVVDEFGGAEGIVTLEDILEEVVGEIEDEHDVGQPNAQWVSEVRPGEYLVSARVELDTFAEQIGHRLPDGKYETLGGFLLEVACEIPPPGTRLAAAGLIFEIDKASERAIEEVRVLCEPIS